MGGNKLVENRKIFTEAPEEEMWRSLLRFSYKANIKRYFDAHGIRYSENKDETNYTNIDILSNSISGALLQADEYYKASKAASLQVSPLLLYYGTTNLLYSMYALEKGKIPDIKNHGIHITTDPEETYIADTELKFDHYKDGGVHQFAPMLGFSGNLCDYRGWSLGDFFDSIAEINDDFVLCYPDKHSHILMIDVVKTPESVVEKVDIKGEEATLMFSHIENFSNSYLKPQIGCDQTGSYFTILRHKMNGTKIEQYSYSGQPYLQVAHEKDGKSITLPRELNMYISLFVLSSLCRYHPEIWNPFVIQDSTGEKLLVGKLLYYSRRLIPNTILNSVEKHQISFVSDKYLPDDRVHLVGEHEVKELVSKEVKKQLRNALEEKIVKSR